MRTQKLFKPPVPRARPPLRRYKPGETDFHKSNDSKELLRMNTYDLRGQQKYFNKLDNSNLRYTDSGTDTDDENEDGDYDDKYSDDSDDDEENRDIDVDDLDDGSLTRRLNTAYLSPPRLFTPAHSTPIDKQELRKRGEYESRSSNVTTSPKSPKVKSKKQNQSTKSSTKHSNFLLYTIICIIAVIFFFCIQASLKNKVDKEVTVQENKLREIYLSQASTKLGKSVNVIRKRFQNQKADIWNDISAGIYDVALFPTRPSIIILFGNETETLNCLARLLAEVSGDILGSNDHLTLMSDDFPNDVGQVIASLKERIVQKKAVVVQDLLSINTEALKAFHNFCDREKPLVAHAVYIITIIVDGYKATNVGLRFVEQQIYKRLKGQIDMDIVSPLVTRITDGVIAQILPEPNTKFNNSYCSLPVNKS